MRDLAKSIRRAALRPGFSLGCIAAAAAASAASFFLPRAELLGSPWLLLPLLMAAGALAYSVSLQGRALAAWAGRRPAEAARLPGEGPAIEAMGRRGYTLASAAGDRGGRVLFFERNGLGRLGSAAFHGGLVVAVCSGLWSLAFEQRGFVQLFEGETFTGQAREFASVKLGAWAGEFRAPMRLTLERFADRYWDDREVKSYESILTVMEDGRQYERTVSVNHPVRVAGCAVYQSSHFGYAASLLLERSGRRRSRQVTTFLLDQPPRAGGRAAAFNELPESPYWVRLRLSPDRRALEATVLAGGRIVYQGPLEQGPVRIGGDRLSWIALRRWSGLIVTRRTAAAGAYLAFALCAAGGSAMLLFPWRRLALAAGPDGWRVAAASRAERALAAEEAGEIERELRAAAASPEKETHGPLVVV